MYFLLGAVEIGLSTGKTCDGVCKMRIEEGDVLSGEITWIVDGGEASVMTWMNGAP